MADTDSIYRPDALIAQDIDAYLAQHQNKTLLRFITCGSVDDGKSTLIGRLLYDSKQIFEDQLASVAPTDSTDQTSTAFTNAVPKQIKYLNLKGLIE